MAKTFRVSPHVGSQIEDFQEKEAFAYGLILGQFSSQEKEYLIVHLARTPIEEQEDVDAAEDTSPLPNVDKVENIDSIWTMEHCKQVRAMLPGGIDIHGIFVVSSENIQNNKKAKNVIDECCTVIQKVKRADNITDSSSTSTPLTFLQIDPKNHTTKADSWTTDQGKTKHLSFEQSEINWLCLKANLILDLPLAFTEEQTARPLSQKLETAVKRLGKSLDHAVFLINGQFMEHSQFIHPQKSEDNKKNNKNESGKKKGGKKAQHHKAEETTTTEGTCTSDDDGYRRSRKSAKDFVVDILFDEESSSKKDCEVANITAKMNIMGRMSVRAYVNEHSNFEFASIAIKNDIIRTFKARMEMHYDSLVGEEMGGTDVNLHGILHEPPRRVNICLPDDSITVSDLLFPGETPEESVKAVEEMLGFTPQFEQLDDELEIVASPQTVKLQDGESRAESPVLEKKASESPCSTFQIILSVAVVLLAIGGSYLLTMSEDETPVVNTEFATADDDHINAQ